MINLSHELCRLSDIIDWKQADAIVTAWFESDLGRPAKDSRLIAGLFFIRKLDLNPNLWKPWRAYAAILLWSIKS